MNDTKVDIKDLEAFIDGLQTSLDMLDGADITEAKGFQAQLANYIKSKSEKNREIRALA